MDPQDQEGFRDYVDARWSTLLRLADLLTGGDRHEAEDLVQIVLMKALGRWRYIEDPDGYVRKVMYRQQISRWRLRRPHREVTFAAPPEDHGVADGTSDADLRITVRSTTHRSLARLRGLAPELAAPAPAAATALSSDVPKGART